ncbi:hypothetical protein NUW54_g13910 [Trametes sanguinea]|uniref:Uncharacterized protein n=1 Tax=Trametes sanguinea TaxID=158606 RepID=A0ACC1MH93_9APHY|nr:hypothetical protein NUW54_g13910 [Trametes sanguinea]
MSQPSRAPPQSQQKVSEFKFRTKPVQERTIFESFAVLPARTRLYISLGITAFAAAGIYVSDQLEKAFPATKEPAAISKPPPQAPTSTLS